MQYLEAVRCLKQEGVRLTRSIHITFVPGIDLLRCDITFVCIRMVAAILSGRNVLQ